MTEQTTESDTAVASMTVILEKHPQLERVAIAFSFQMLPEVPTEPTDICPQIIVTEEEICYLTD